MELLYGGRVVCRAVAAGSDEVRGYAEARAKTAVGEKVRLVRDKRCAERPVLAELMGSFTCGNPYEENVCLGWLEGESGMAAARLIDEGCRVFGVVTGFPADEGGEGLEIAVVMREQDVDN